MTDEPRELSPDSILDIVVAQARPMSDGKKPVVGLAFRGKALGLAAFSTDPQGYRGDGSTLLLFDLEKAEALLLDLQDALQKARAGKTGDPSETAH